MIELPTKKAKPTDQNPGSMIIFSQPKMGKTTLAAQLEDALIIDLENGSKFVDAMRVNANDYEELKEIIIALRNRKQELNGKNPYTYGIIDTVSKLEELALPRALMLYKKTPMGKNFKGTDILSLPNGLGYKYLRDAMNQLSNMFEELFDHVIFIAHLKEKSIDKDGKEITSKDIALTGRLATILPANVDAVGYLHRDRKNNLFLNFQASDELCAGARPPHLRGQDIQVATNENGEITYHWDRIFIP